jgi:glycosyltransferase involved in cell wall biosynthesis
MTGPSLTIVAPSQGVYGGIEITALAQAEHAISHGPCLLHFKLTKGYALKDSLKGVIEEAGVPCRVTGRGLFALWSSISNAEVVHAHNVAVDVVACTCLLGKPLFLTIHNRFHRENWRHWVGRVLQHLAIHRVYNSHFVQSSWDAINTRTASRFPSVSRMPPVTPKPCHQKKGFFFIGRWVANKGIETLLQAYSQARIDKAQQPLFLAGGGPLHAELCAFIHREKLEGVTVLGFLSDEEKYAWFGKVRWNVAPRTRLEDMGLTPIEARHCGTPSVITDDGGLTEAAGPGALVCQPGSVASLRAALEQAAAMDQQEYEHRCKSVKSELETYLRSYDELHLLYPRRREAERVV